MDEHLGPIYQQMCDSIRLLNNQMTRIEPRCLLFFIEPEMNSHYFRNAIIPDFFLTVHSSPGFFKALFLFRQQIRTNKAQDRFYFALLESNLKLHEKDILTNQSNPSTKKLDKVHLEELMKKVSLVQCKDLVIDYIQSLKKQAGKIKFDAILSTRTLLFAVQISKAYAFLQNKDYVTFDEVQKTFPYILRHRIKNFDSHVDIINYIQKEVIEKVALPR